MKFFIKIIFISIFFLPITSFSKKVKVRQPFVSEQGRWQYFELSSSWANKMAKIKGFKNVNVVMLPPHPTDIFSGEFGPCVAPPRLAIIAVDPKGKTFTHQFDCVKLCDDGLFGRLTRLDGIRPVINQKSNELEVSLYYKRNEYVNSSEKHNLNNTVPIKLSEETKVRKKVYKAKDLFQFKKGLGSCSAS